MLAPEEHSGGWVISKRQGESHWIGEGCLLDYDGMIGKTEAKDGARLDRMRLHTQRDARSRRYFLNNPYKATKSITNQICLPAGSLD